jgi:hypothetical protein
MGCDNEIDDHVDEVMILGSLCSLCILTRASDLNIDTLSSS